MLLSLAAAAAGVARLRPPPLSWKSAFNVLGKFFVRFWVGLWLIVWCVLCSCVYMFVFACWLYFRWREMVEKCEWQNMLITGSVTSLCCWLVGQLVFWFAF